MADKTNGEAVDAAAQMEMFPELRPTGPNTMGVELTPQQAAGMAFMGYTGGMMRRGLGGSLGKQYQGDRDMYTALGYTKNLRFDDYLAAYLRQDIAPRLVEIWPDETWQSDPILAELGNTGEELTQFEQAWIDLVKQLDLYHYLHRLDLLLGIGRYGVMLLGFDDVNVGQATASDPNGEGPFATAVTSAKELLWVRPLMEQSADIKNYVTNIADRRYNQPNQYTVKLDVGDGTSQTHVVHASRLIHVAEKPMENDIIGLPRLERVFNRLMDMERVAGGSGEMFWRGAFPGIHADIQEDAVMPENFLSEMQSQLDDYTHNLARALKTQGVDITMLNPTVASPQEHVDVLLTLIAVAAAVPKRILMGSERGELASTQDEKAWNKRVARRQAGFAGPRIIKPLVDRLIEVGVMPTPSEEGYAIQWDDLHAPSEEDQANTFDKQMSGLQKYVAAGPEGEMVMTRKQLRLRLGMTEDEIAEAEAGEVELQAEIDAENAEIKKQEEAAAKVAADAAAAAARPSPA